MSNAPTRTRPHPTSRGAAHRHRPPRRSRLVLPVAVGGIALLAVISVVIGMATQSGDKDKTPTVLQTRAVDVAGTPLPSFTSPVADPAVGRRIPEAQGESFDGTPVTIAPDGTPKLIAFVAHWCPHCRNEVPVMVKWLGGGEPQGVKVVAVSSSVDQARPNYPPSAWLERESWTIPTIADDEQGTAAAAFGLSGYPYFVAVTADGKVAARASGEQTVAQLDALVAAARG